MGPYLHFRVLIFTVLASFTRPVVLSFRDSANVLPQIVWTAEQKLDLILKNVWDFGTTCLSFLGESLGLTCDFFYFSDLCTLNLGTIYC